MEFEHTSVLAEETIHALALRQDGTYVDGTLGGGGHAALICERLSESGRLLGIDRDADALAAAQERLAGFRCERRYARANFDNIKRVLAENDIARIDGALLDLGVSSYQLDNPERGFSYMRKAPLDMRMDRIAGGDPPNTAGMYTTGMSAAEIVNGYSAAEITRVLREYGEERWANRIAQFIVRERQESPITDTERLSEIIKAAIPAAARREGPHPAKRSFMALRREVNDELGALARAIDDFIEVLASGGRLAVISFDSLEDRIVKEAFRRHEQPCTCPPGLPCVCGKQADAKRLTKKPIMAGETELAGNPRARSAKLRVLEKL